MEVLDEYLGTTLARDGEKYFILIDSKSHASTRVQSEAFRVFRTVTPRKVKCDACGEIDVVRFRGELDVGRLMVAGECGWRAERIFGGLVEFRDVATCPECTVKIAEEMGAWRNRVSKKR